MDSKWRTGVAGGLDKWRKRFGSHLSLLIRDLVEYLVEREGYGGILGMVQAESRLRPIMEDATWLLSMMQLRIIQQEG